MRQCLACQHGFEAQDWRCPACGYEPVKQGAFPLFAPQLARENGDFNPHFFELMAAVEPRHFWFLGRNRIIADLLEWKCGKPRTILEIGCGTGFVLSTLRDRYPLAKLRASDIYPEGLAFAQQRVPTAELLQMDARHIPYLEEFDLLGAFDVLEHIDEDEAVLASLFQAAKPGAWLVLTVPQHRWLWSRMDEFAHHKRRYTRGELTNKLQEAGFIVEHVTSFVSLLLPFMLVGRLLRQPRGEEMEDQMEAAGLRVGKLSNALFGLAMRFEAALLRFGIRFPAGGSLLVLARKPEGAACR